MCRYSFSKSMFALLVMLLVSGAFLNGSLLGAEKVIAVDCSAGESIIKALGKGVEEVVVEISGVCTENVVIRRDNVILRGSDPELDGIQSAVEGEGVVLTVRDATNVQVENLSLAGGILGLEVINSNAASGPSPVKLTNCRLEGNLSKGAGIVDSVLVAVQTQFLNNSYGGMFIADGSLFNCQGCTFDNGDTWDLDLRSFSRATVMDSTLAGSVRVQNSSHLSLIRSPMTRRLLVSNLSEADIFQGSIGWFTAEDKSIVALRGTEQVNPDFRTSQVWNDSYLKVETTCLEGSGGVCTLEAPTLLSGDILIMNFSKGHISPESTNDGMITCGSGGDFFCPDPGQIECSGCGLCP